jgi:Probable Zinc-ribbon domain
VTLPGARGHVFSGPVAVRQPTERHPDSGAACPACEHVYARHEGVKTGRDFVFGHAEIARLFLRIGEGMSLREASRELRASVFRVHRGHASKGIRAGATSRECTLAANYLDAFAPAVVEALHPRSWPRVVVLDAKPLLTRGYRRGSAEGDEPERRAGNLKAGTILVAMDPTGSEPEPCLMQVKGGGDSESWKAFFATLEGAPSWVVADLDPAIARAVREAWPGAILYHSRHHLAQLMRTRAAADGVPERIRLAEPVALGRPLPWTGSPTRRLGEHPLYATMLVAQRGPLDWAAFKALVEQYIPPERLALRSWIATNELLIERQWRLAYLRAGLPLSTGALEGKIGEWLAPLARRAGRWQNRRRLDLVLGLTTLRGRGEAHQARYAKLVRAAFAARANRSHTAAENTLPLETYHGSVRQLSWWRSWQDRSEPSLPRLVRDADRRTRRRAADDHAARVRERLAERYAAEVDLRRTLGLPVPPVGRPKRPSEPRGSVKGRLLADYEELLLEWDWAFNGELDPRTLAAGSHGRVAWRCLLDPAHVWETRVSDRTYHGSTCPYHMGLRVHPAESLAAYFPWLAAEWHPERNALRPHEVARASARRVVWRCEQGHEWSAAVYQRTLSKSGCPVCYRLEASVRSKAGKARAWTARARKAAGLAALEGLPAEASQAS